MNIYEQNYKNISLLINDILTNKRDYIKITRSGYMPLTIELLNKTSEYIVISMTHYYEQNGDLMADPDMEIQIYPTKSEAYALTYQQDNLGIYHTAEDGESIKASLNLFLKEWLNNLKLQGFY